jgi:Ferritin-like domain
MARSCRGHEEAVSFERSSRVGLSRRDLARRGAAVGAGALVGGVLFTRRSQSAAAVPSRTQDEKIFNFALLLEYLQAAFYSEAVANGALRGDVADFAAVAADHERQHVDFLRRALGAKARQRPQFDFGDATHDERKFLSTGVLLENLGVAAYNGQAASLTKPALSAAAEIVSVEGRHAAWISDLAGDLPAPHPADPGKSAGEVVAALQATRFIRKS